MQCNASDLDGMETPTQQIKQCFRPGWNVTPTQKTKQCFRPVWNSDPNPVDKAMPQALIEQRPQDPGWNEDFNNSRQSNASGLDGKKTSTIADKAMLQAWMERWFQQSKLRNSSSLDGTKTLTIADKALLQAWMEQRLQQWQTKQCFRPGWNEDFNNSRQKTQQKNRWFKPYIDCNSNNSRENDLET